MAALDRHKSRAEYLLDNNMVYSSPFSVCSQLPRFQAYGWVMDKDGTISVDWDDDQTVSFLTGTDKGCSCKKNNSTSCKCACNKQPCTIRCGCKDNCKNPYNKHSSAGLAPNNDSQHQRQDSDSQSESDTSDTEQLLVEGEVQYDSDEYDLEI